MQCWRAIARSIQAYASVRPRPTSPKFTDTAVLLAANLKVAYAERAYFTKSVSLLDRIIIILRGSAGTLMVSCSFGSV